MKQRVLSGIIFALVAVAAFVVNVFFGYTFSLLAALVAVLCVFELYRCVDIPRKGIFFACAEVFTAGALLLFLPGYAVTTWMFAAQIVLTAAFLVVTAANAFCSRDGRSKTLYLGGITLLITLSIGILTCWGTVCMVSQENKHTILGILMLVVTLMAPFASDIAGLLVGMSFGKHKMAPTVSPKKSWEGFIGSLVGAPLLLMLIGLVSDFFCRRADYPLRANLLSLLLTGLIGAVIGTSGDLFFSLIKRKAGIKDYGSILPGHGGMLDRFDSVIFTTIPVTALYLLLPQFA